MRDETIRNAQDMTRRLRLSSREIAAALALTIAAGAFLFAALADQRSRAATPVAAFEERNLP